MEEIEYWLHRYINRTVVWPDGTVVMAKELLGRVREMKIEMYANDHNPPHFHVKSRDGSIDAVFSLTDCSFIQGTIDGKDQRRIREFYNSNKDMLTAYWEDKVVKQQR